VSRHARLLTGALFLCWLPACTAEAAPVMEFVPPAAGAYKLERIQAATEGAVLDSGGRRRRLSEFTHGRVTLLAFMYTSCADPNGCPYALTVMHLVKNELEKLPQARGRVRFVSLSFDPVRDTPQVIALYGRDHNGREHSGREQNGREQNGPEQSEREQSGPEQNGREQGGREQGGREQSAREQSGHDHSGRSRNAAAEHLAWEFLTTRSRRELLPILNGFGQDVGVDIDRASGKALGSYSHVLKVFLIDRHGAVREIYTTDYLLPAMVLNDIKTLLMEDGVRLQ